MHSVVEHAKTRTVMEILIPQSSEGGEGLHLQTLAFPISTTLFERVQTSLVQTVEP